MRDEHEVRRQSIDPNRLLPGEEPNSQQPDDAEHWITVYSQLRETKLQVIANLRDLMEGQSDDVRDELERADIRMLQMQVERFEKRMAFWQQRGAELTEREPAAG